MMLQANWTLSLCMLALIVAAVCVWKGWSR